METLVENGYHGIVNFVASLIKNPSLHVCEKDISNATKNIHFADPSNPPPSP